MTTTSTPKSRLVSKKEVIALLGWPTQCFAVDHRLGNGVEDLTVIPHTYVIFVPGNPGLIDWYVPFFEGMVRSLGPGYAARGVSNAGHSTDSELVNVSVWTTNKQTEYSPSDESSLNKENRDTCIPWTIDGQVHHKIAFIDKILERHEQECANRHEATQSCSFIFVSHSIGCHFTQKVAIMRPDILQRTQHFVHLMPYFRMKAPPHMQQFLDFGASVPNAIIAIHKALLSFLSVSPRFVADMAMRRSIRDTDARNIAVDLIQQPEFAVNFFSLGLEEIRDVPEVFDVCALRVLGSYAPTSIVFTRKDHWAPGEVFVDEIKTLQSRGTIPRNIDMHYAPHLQHDFITDPSQVDFVLDVCLSDIRRRGMSRARL